MRIEVVRKVLARNQQAAADNRRRFDEAGVCCINLLGGPGCGKTTLLEAVLPRLAPLRVAVVEGDLETTRDAERIAALGIPAVQVLTEGGCHLTAAAVAEALARLDLAAVDLVIIENVGNPICPANYDLGEHARIAVLSVAEGDDKPAKYPLLFRDAELVVLTKCDLLPHVPFDVGQASEGLARVCPRARIVRCAALAGHGVAEVADVLRAAIRENRPGGGWASRSNRMGPASFHQ